MEKVHHLSRVVSFEVRKCKRLTSWLQTNKQTTRRIEASHYIKHTVVVQLFFQANLSKRLWWLFNRILYINKYLYNMELKDLALIYYVATRICFLWWSLAGFTYHSMFSFGILLLYFWSHLQDISIVYSRKDQNNTSINMINRHL